MIISPLIGSLSDAYGRKYIVAAGRLGTALFFISTAPGMPWLRAGGEAAMRAQAFLNVVSGVIFETVLHISHEDEQHRVRKEKERRIARVEKLYHLFTLADTDGSAEPDL